MGEWQAWHPTVSRQSRSTDITDGFGPGTRWSAGPESYIDEVVAASPMFWVPSGPPARRPGLRCFLALVSLSWCLRAAARPRDRHTRACGSEWSISKPGQALPPPPGTDSVPEYRSRPFCSLRNLAGVVVACAKRSQCLTGVESQNDRKCAGDGSFHAR